MVEHVMNIFLGYSLETENIGFDILTILMIWLEGILKKLASDFCDLGSYNELETI